jgi:hypothetical protein
VLRESIALLTPPPAVALPSVGPERSGSPLPSCPALVTRILELEPLLRPDRYGASASSTQCLQFPYAAGMLEHGFAVPAFHVLGEAHSRPYALEEGL